MAANLNSSLLEGNAATSLNVAIVSGAGGSHIDDAAFTAGTDDISMSGGFFNDSTPDSVDEGDGGALRMAANRVGYRTLRDAAGNERGQNVSAQFAAAVEGDVAHDGPDLGAPLKWGAKAIDFGIGSVTTVADGDRTDVYASRNGVLWTLGGHPGIVTREYVATTAQTNDAIITASSALKIIVTAISVTVDNAVSVDVGVRIGFGTSAVPTIPTDGNSVNSMILSHPGIAPGSGVVLGSGAGMLGGGALDEDLRITSEVPTSGSLRVIISFVFIAG